MCLGEMVGRGASITIDDLGAWAKELQTVMMMVWLLYVNTGVYDWKILYVNGGFRVSDSEGQFQPSCQDMVRATVRLAHIKYCRTYHG